MKKKTKADLEKELQKLKKQIREQSKELKHFKELHELCLKRWCM